VREQSVEASLTPQLLKHRHRLTVAGNQMDAVVGQRRDDFSQALTLKGGVTRAPLWLGEELWLVEKDCQNGGSASLLCGGGQGGMVLHTQIALQPDAKRGTSRCHLTSTASENRTLFGPL
jgi:hypothetical protein